MTLFIIIVLSLVILMALIGALSGVHHLASGAAWASAVKWIAVALIAAAIFTYAIDRGVLG